MKALLLGTALVLTFTTGAIASKSPSTPAKGSSATATGKATAEAAGSKAPCTNMKEVGKDFSILLTELKKVKTKAQFENDIKGDAKACAEKVHEEVLKGNKHAGDKNRKEVGELMTTIMGK
jgi:hypothetical protein